MVFILLHSLLSVGDVYGVGEPEFGPSGNSKKNEIPPADDRSIDVFRSKTGKTVVSCQASIERLVSLSESKGGVRLNPASLPKIGIKIETSCSPGLQVSPVLVDALLLFLKERGYRNDQVFLADHDLMTLRSAGFAKGSGNLRFFRGYPLYCSEDKFFFNPDWYHDSPMPPTPQDRVRFFLRYPHDREKRIAEERKSYLPARLFLDDVHWINLAVAMDSLNLGIDGAAANFSLGAIDNARRFLEKPTLAPAAVAEILAIPEIWQKRVFSIIDLSKFQFAGGERFDAEFLERDPVLMLSENPFSVDYLALQRLNESRIKMGFLPRKFEDALMFRYAKELGLGNVRDCKVFDLP
jgi:hypothetical protein